MKRKIAMAVLIAMLAVTCMSMMSACVKDEPLRKVNFEILNPITKEPITYKETIELPDWKALLEVRIKDQETGEYLTDEDFPENTVNKSYSASFSIFSDEGKRVEEWWIKSKDQAKGYWPTKEELEKWPRSRYNHYEIYISFDCRPERPEHPEKFKRKYNITSYSMNFYINKLVT